MASRTNIELEILEAIDEGRHGFRGGFVSSDALRGVMERHKVGRKRWLGIMTNLKYIMHPGVTDGRVSSPLSDGSRPRLYVRRDHDSLRLVGGAVGEAYDAAQASVPSAVSPNVVPFKRP